MMAVSRCISCGGVYEGGTCTGCPSVQFATGCTITMTNTPLEDAAKACRDAMGREAGARTAMRIAREAVTKAEAAFDRAQVERCKAEKELLTIATPGYLRP